MRYPNTVEAVFRSRPNRFIAKVEIDGREETVHVKNTGRCRELLTDGARVYLTRSDNPSRRTSYDLIAVEKPREGKKPLVVNIDSQAPNTVAAEWLLESGLFSRNAVIRREVTRGNSRFDFMIEDNGRITYLEVKGCTLETDGVALFPDAPTERGVKHVDELTALAESGTGAAILIVIQMKGVTKFKPNYRTHRAFGEALSRAKAAGVSIFAVDCNVTPDELDIDCFIDVELSEGDFK